MLGVALLAVALFGITKGRHALDQRGRGDPASEAAEDRHAADAGLVVPAPRGSARAAEFIVAVACWPLMPMG